MPAKWPWFERKFDFGFPVEKHPDEIDATSDVCSLGVILYELLAGEHPYPVKGEMFEMVKHITETEPTPPSKVWTAESGVSRRKSGRFRVGQCPIDDELQTVVLTALSKERERRYQTAEALRQDISRYLCVEPIEAKRDTSLYVLMKSPRSNQPHHEQRNRTTKVSSWRFRLQYLSCCHSASG